MSSGEWHQLLTNPLPGLRRGRLRGSVWTNQKPGEMSKLRCGASRRILPRVPPGLGAGPSSCTAGSAEAEQGLVIRCYKSWVRSTSLLRRPPPRSLFSVRDAAAHSCSDLLKKQPGERHRLFFERKKQNKTTNVLSSLFFVPSFVFLAPLPPFFFV